MTKAEKTFIKNLQKSKSRKEHGMFLVEGEKDIQELLNSNFKIVKLYSISSWIENNSPGVGVDFSIINSKELGQISSHSSSRGPIAIVKIPDSGGSEKVHSENISFFFEQIQDPGNLGTIIRTADWFGYKNLILSENSVDCFNPKVVTASKGAIFRVKIHYHNSLEYLTKERAKGKKLVCTDSNPGKNKADLNDGKMTIIFGNESRGLPNEIKDLCQASISISGSGSGESLNLSVSAAIIMRDCYKTKIK